MIKALQNFTKTSWPRLLSLVITMQMFAFALTASATTQEVGIKGTVTDAGSNEALIGVSIVIKGTTTGGITDIDGNYQVTANTGDVLVFSYMGYLSEEITVANQETVDVSLAQDLVGLDEVVVVGYGTQKKKLNTGATLNMKGEDLQKMNTVGAMSSLQGISPGVSITNESGKPGAGTKVNIRGIGTIGDSSPLYVVDGVQVGDIDYLNPADIQSIDVLKDAASCAIYGSQAANGVVLVTTKQGKKGSKGATISYDMYFGFKQVAKEPGMLGAKDFMAAKDEGAKNSGTSANDWSAVDRYDDIMNGSYDGTDWFNNMVNDEAYIQSHSVGITDGNERSVYSVGASYLKDNGLLGTQAKPDFQRITARLNSNHTLKKWNGLDGIVFGQNLTYSNTQDPNIGTGDIYDNDVRNHNVANPLLPVYDEDGNYTDNITVPAISINPTAKMEYTRQYNENNNNNIVGSAYLEIQPIAGLKVKSQFGITNDYGSSRSWTPSYDMSPTEVQIEDEVQQVMYSNFKWILTNTVAYDFNIQQQHNFNVVLGQESQEQARELKMDVTNQSSIFETWDYAYLTNVPVASAEAIKIEGRDDYGWAMSSYFGRLSYDFKEKYMLTGVVRRDGSSNFGADNRYAIFPSVSAGWILSQEDFMANVAAVSYLKLRGSWGQNGNQRIDAFQYAAGVEYVDANYPFGPDYSNNTIGSQLANLPNPAVRWETSEQTNIGLDVHMLNSRLQGTVEWYKKSTKDWLIQAPVLGTAGAEAPFVNGGMVINQGVEASLKWSDQVNDFKYSLTGTLGYNDNEVTAIENAEGVIHGKGGNTGGALWQGFGESYRAEVGYPIGYFWGYETNGVAQTQADIDGYHAMLIEHGTAVDPEYTLPKKIEKMVPGDVMYLDNSGGGENGDQADGKISEDDKLMIGNPNAKLSYGIQLSLDYKGFYLQAVGVGKVGHQVMMSYSTMGDNLVNENITQYYYDNAFDADRNPSGTLPMITSKTNVPAELSDLFVYDADYFRISNITLGYSFNNLVKTDLFSDLRLYVTGQNLFTFTDYPGMDPEVAWGNNDDWASGVDVGLYPLSKTYMMGLSVKF